MRKCASIPLPKRGSKVTAVVPTYNDPEHLCVKLDELLAQSWPPQEVVVVDDASDEPVETLVRERLEGRLPCRIIRHAENQGVVGALSNGLSAAGGEIVYLSSTNDPIMPDFLAFTAAALQAYPHAALAFCDPGVIQGWSGKRQHFPQGLAPQPCFFTAEDMAVLQRRAPFHIASNTVLFRRAALEGIGGCRSEFGVYADWYACTILSLTCGAVYIPRVLGYSRCHSGAFSKSVANTRQQRRESLARMLRAIARERPQAVETLRQAEVLSNFRPFDMLMLCKDPEIRKFLGKRSLFQASARYLWRLCLPVVPLALRRALRAHISRRALGAWAKRHPSKNE